jgi:dCTP deaminase
MTTLVDHQIRQLARDCGLIEPFEPELVNPASYDVTVGSTVLIEANPKEIDQIYPGCKVVDQFVEWDLLNYPLTLEPGEFILAHTREFIRVPINMEAVFCLKSSRGREGWEHALAGYIDPGFHGRVTLELKNNNRYHPLELRAGMRIGQLRFMKLDDVPLRPYSFTGRYQGDTTVQASRG